MAATAVVVPAVCQASGFALLEQSASRLGTAFAGTAAAADDATTIYFNPAGLSHLGRGEAIIVASGVGINSEFRSSGSQPALGQPLGGEGGDAGDWHLIPSAYLSWPVNDEFAIGIGFNAPFGLVTDYDAGWMGRFQALRSEIETMNFNPSISWRANERFSLGLGVSFQRLDAELTNSVNYSAAIAQGVQQLVQLGELPAAAAPAVIAANAGQEGRARVRGHDSAWGFNLGLLFDVTPTTRIGLAYRSAVDYDVEGTINFAAPSPTHPVGQGVVAAVSAPGGALSNGPVSVDIELPASALLSLRQEVGDRFVLLADIGWTEWSSVQELRIVRDTGVTASVTPEEWDDAWRFALGGAYELSDRWTLRAGVAFDDSAVPDSTRTPRLPDTERYWLAVGASWRPSDSLTVDFGYAHLFSDDVPLDQDAGNPAASGLLLGEQESYIDVVATQVVWRF
jgi:long-chain fatty acid transport protein